MKRVVIIGAGGHGREVAEILRNSHRDSTVLGFVDDKTDRDQKVINDLPILGGWSWFEGVDRSELFVICAVGLPQIRKRLVARAASLGLSFCNAVASSAYISPTAKIGRGVMIFPNAVISSDCVVGDHSIVNVGATISHDSLLGCYATVNPGVHVAGNVSVEDGCYLGIGSNIIHGVSIGAWSVVGGGAVVTCDLPGDVTAVGVPARVIKTRERGWHEGSTSAAGQ
jgi:sugar O-acyltransferase (sialic acid O-acetyltransferase NeuD family)